MNDSSNEKDNKIAKLTVKCNKQLDYIHDLENQLKERDRKIQEYKIIMQNSDNNFVNDSVHKNIINKNMYQELCNAFFKTIEYIVRNNGNIDVKRVGKVSISNMIVQAGYFKGLVGNYITILDTNKVIKLWSDLGMIRLNENKGIPYFSYSHQGKSIRTVRISNYWVDLVKESMLQHD